MIVFPNAKINLGLNIVSKRDDGFHNIETCFIPVSLSDILEFQETEENISFSSSGISIPGASDKNICLEAWRLINETYGIPNVKIHLHKNIPIGAGLGGGSSDGAFMLKALNEHFDLNISKEKLHDYALTLGSDCPFFLMNKPAIGTGRGDVLKPFDLMLDNYKIALVNPGIHVSTALAYSSTTPEQPHTSLDRLLKRPIGTWMEHVKNDFEPSVFKEFAEIRKIKEKLHQLGAVYTAMSGSGSTVFGIFYNEVPNKLEDFFKGSFVFYKK